MLFLSNLVIFYFECSFSDLIKSHKKIPSERSVFGVQPCTVQDNSRSFSWQRPTQKGKTTKQQTLQPSLNHVRGQSGRVNSSYSLDRRKLNSQSSGTVYIYCMRTTCLVWVALLHGHWLTVCNEFTSVCFISQNYNKILKCDWLSPAWFKQ